MEDDLNRDMDLKLHLQLSVWNMLSAAYSRINLEPRGELDIYPSRRVSMVLLDKILSYKQHLEEVKTKITAKMLLIPSLLVQYGELSNQILWLAKQDLCPKYCVPAWTRILHATKVDTTVKSSLWMVTDHLEPTSMPQFDSHLITPCTFPRDAATLTPARKAQMYYSCINRPTNSFAIPTTR